MMNGIKNMMRREAERSDTQRAQPRRAIVSAYDPNRYAAKVIIQPEGFETGFIPIGAEWVGSGWGLYCPPTPGDEVEVNFQEGGKNAPYIGKRFYGNEAPPLAVPSGEFWLIHKSGSLIKLTNDGKLTIEDKAGSFLTLNADGTATLKANLTVQGSIVATGDISDQNGADGTVAHIRTVYDTHTHSGVQTGGGNTGTPNQPL
jgi:uncharacterized protein involved in type VI secretion and phage assembly